MKKLLFILLIAASGAASGQMLVNPYFFPSTAFDADAVNYINRVQAAGRTLSLQEQARISTYFAGLKATGVWAKIHDRGLLIWGSAAANAETFKGVNDITWSGTVTHAADGAISNGSTGYGNTGIVPSVSLSLTSVHYAAYSQTNLANSSQCDLGVRVTNSQSMAFFLRIATNMIIGDAYTINTGTGRISVANSTSIGYFHISRISGTDIRAFANGAQIGATNTAAQTGTLPNIATYLMCINNAGVAANFTARKYSLWSVGSGLTTTEAADDNTLTEAFMDAMGIGVQ